MIMQEGRPLTFFSETLHGLALALSTYEKEIIVFLQVVTKWRPYLVDACVYSLITDASSISWTKERLPGKTKMGFEIDGL